MPVIQNLDTGETCEVSEDFIRESRLLSSMLDDTLGEACGDDEPIPLIYKNGTTSTSATLLDSVLAALKKVKLTYGEFLLDYITSDYTYFFEEYAVKNHNSAELKGPVADILEQFERPQLCEAFSMANYLDMETIELAIAFVIGVSINDKYKYWWVYHNEIIYHLRLRLEHIRARGDITGRDRVSKVIESDYKDYGILIDLLGNRGVAISKKTLELINFTASYTMTDETLKDFEMIGVNGIREEYDIDTDDEDGYDKKRDEIHSIGKYTTWFETSRVSDNNLIMSLLGSNHTLVELIAPFELLPPELDYDMWWAYRSEIFGTDCKGYESLSDSVVSLMWNIRDLDIKKITPNPFNVNDRQLRKSIQRDITINCEGASNVKCPCRKCSVKKYMNYVLTSNNRDQCLAYN